MRVTNNPKNETVYFNDLKIGDYFTRLDPPHDPELPRIKLSPSYYACLENKINNHALVIGAKNNFVVHRLTHYKDGQFVT